MALPSNNSANGFPTNVAHEGVQLPVGLVPVVLASDLSDADNVVNNVEVSGKRKHALVMTVSNLDTLAGAATYIATGSGKTAKWVGLDGTSEVTPS